jgi:hypothetical protein
MGSDADSASPFSPRVCSSLPPNSARCPLGLLGPLCLPGWPHGASCCMILLREWTCPLAVKSGDVVGLSRQRLRLARYRRAPSGEEHHCCRVSVHRTKAITTTFQRIYLAQLSSERRRAPLRCCALTASLLPSPSRCYFRPSNIAACRPTRPVAPCSH